MRLSLIELRMPVRSAFYPAVQCQTSRAKDIHLGKKEFARTSQELFPVYIYIYIYIYIQEIDTFF